MSEQATQSSAAEPSDLKHYLSKLQAAAEDLASTRTIDHDGRKTICSDAHQLAHALDVAGLSEAARKAYEVIATLEHTGLPQPERLQQQVQALSALLER